MLLSLLLLSLLLFLPFALSILSFMPFKDFFRENIFQNFTPVSNIFDIANEDGGITQMIYIKHYVIFSMYLK